MNREMLLLREQFTRAIMGVADVHNALVRSNDEAHAELQRHLVQLERIVYTQTAWGRLKWLLRGVTILPETPKKVLDTKQTD